MASSACAAARFSLSSLFLFWSYVILFKVTTYPIGIERRSFKDTDLPLNHSDILIRLAIKLPVWRVDDA